MNREQILVVEDNDTIRLGIAETLKRDGYSVVHFDNGPDALSYVSGKAIPIAIVDLKMEPMDGMEVLEKLREADASIEVLIISAFGTVDSAVKAMHLGATDFLTKPFSPEELRIRIRKILEKISGQKKLDDLTEQNRLLREELFTGYDEIIGSSPQIRGVFDIIDQVAGKDSTILVQGESGTGKELFARAIHNKSRRKDNPFIRVNCGALNDNLLESELFGHEKGAFTGAIKQKKGRFELANKGTLFLDEIGDISPAMQVKLLRVLQEEQFERVGGEITLDVDIRIIAATHRDLKKMIMQGTFREDLYYRLSVIPVCIPSLRQRKEDIPELAGYFLRKVAAKNCTTVKSIDQAGLHLLVDYPWPGNIRELENLIERLSVISPGENINTELIASHLCSRSAVTSTGEGLPLEDMLYEYERNLLMQAMKKSNGVKNRAAKFLGISTSVLYYKLEKFGLL